MSIWDVSSELSSILKMNKKMRKIYSISIRNILFQIYKMELMLKIYFKL